MQQINSRRLALLAAGFAVAAWAGSAAAQPAPAAHETNIPGVTASPAPPANFDAVNASDAALGTYGFPPRPDASSNPTGYARWAAAVGADRHRLSPQLQQTIIRHGPHVPTSALVIAGAATSGNWSGYAEHVATASYLKHSFTTVAGNLVVPSVTARTCDGNWEYSSAWVGIDGYSSSDVLQAGVEADAQCELGLPQNFYSPWYEWYPNYETRITNLTAEPGQSFYVHVWATSATAGHAYLTNLNTSTSVSLNFSAPSGTQLIGESAEWIVESPSVGGTLATLPLYGLDYFAGTTSETGGGAVRAPGATSSIAISLVRSGVTYSVPGLLGNGGVLFTSY